VLSSSSSVLLPPTLVNSLFCSRPGAVLHNSPSVSKYPSLYLTHTLSILSVVDSPTTSPSSPPPLPSLSQLLLWSSVVPRVGPSHSLSPPHHQHQLLHPPHPLVSTRKSSQWSLSTPSPS
jgi:hypothetical protein